MDSIKTESIKSVRLQEKVESMGGVWLTLEEEWYGTWSRQQPLENRVHLSCSEFNETKKGALRLWPVVGWFVLFFPMVTVCR